ncbi:carboxypeptidase regulatory-like domain-containing protein [Streptosporangiaceae bacterium NEAU-GS5]|nr:carboxypeptidase regulatory-like domain-containing protein [Streptosporangiaceae bacterium NEAU-GS5]
MDEPTSPDLALEDELRKVVALFDPVPPALFDDAMYAFSARRLDAELAELTFDSLWEGSATRIRGAGQHRTLAFEGGGVAVELEIAESGGGRRLIGRLEPGRAAQITVQRRDAETTVTTDALGRFTVDAVRDGHLRLHVTFPGAPPVVTTWVHL